ncbi:sensor domain-containing protein [Haloquadratum walsbyi]|jgi:hypothetical protein|uniref:Putative sensor domain-containing protein n=1 Tax=Haloquadratum walsbyi J07HQW2 TaxID=1238425 RepID=U1PNZ2_9EURY|nr:sensor domain-containing protein [Haloquadratum walsbyi]ERG94001.1 MAG: hypothetical protein J07HQW2_00435 [Haloquadratum walsbyi J07HQW2]
MSRGLSTKSKPPKSISSYSLFPSRQQRVGTHISSVGFLWYGSQATDTDTDAADGQSLISRALGVGTRRQTYLNLLYLLARFPLGIAYFTIFITGFSLGVSLIPVMVGILILAGVVGLAGYVGLIEVELLNKLYGQDVSYSVADPRELSITPYLKAIVTIPRNYLLVLFAFVSFVIGLHVFVAIIVGFTLALTLAVAPLVYFTGYLASNTS